ncbi:phosphotransferase [Rhodobacterales bacterium HKCCE3408]|nr:phosphotransferase [Rhodobacterales bacterium HKCCE3408]
MEEAPLAELLPVIDALAQDALALWDLPDQARAHRINVAENVTYRVEAAGGYRAVLRVHRPAYHSRRAIECELAWLTALDGDGVVTTPGVIAGRNGEAIQEARHPELAAPRFLVLFDFIPGSHPDETGDLTGDFRQLGAITARMHGHAMNWLRPEPFERLVWDEAAVFGSRPTWGDWRDAPGVDAAIRQVLEACEARVTGRLALYGKGTDRYGLIHADTRLANLLVDGGAPRLIDFDDCGFGWFMYDFAAAISFIETDPQVAALKAAWLDGYRTVRALPAPDEDEIETFVMLRRMALLAWIGSHIEAPEPQAMAPHFAEGTALLAERYLSGHAPAG